jgi:signal transduction histidine kinase
MTSEPPSINQVVADRHAAPVAVLSFALILVLTVPVVVIALGISQTLGPASLNGVVLTGMLAGAALVGLVAAGAMSILRFRLVGDNVSLAVGLAFALIGVLLVGGGLVLPLLDLRIADSVAVRALVAAGAYTVTALGVVIVAAARHRTEKRLSRSVVFTFASLAVLTTMAVALFNNAELTSDAVSYVLPPTGTVLTPPLIGVWFALAVLLLRPSLRRGRDVLPWFGLALMAMAFAEVIAREVIEVADTWSIGRAAIVILAALMGLNGVGADLGRAFRSQASTLEDERLQRQEVQRRHEQYLAADEEALHDASSSILAIQGAARVLEASEDGMAPEQRRAMMAALSGEVERLHRIIDRSPRSDPVEPFDVAAAVQPVISLRGQDRVVEFVGAGGVFALGRPGDLAEVVQNLIDNALRHAAGPVEVSVGESDGTVHVGIHDRGPGVSETVRGQIFERGVTTHEAGSGLGLFIAQQLMHQQGGDLWVEGRQGGGSSFVAALPVAEKSAVSLSAVADVPMLGTGS